MASIHILLVGDSDIDRWPSEYWPSLPEEAEISVSGYSGATLSQVVAKIRNLLTEEQPHSDRRILVVCAGMNDIGKSVPLQQTEQAFQQLLEVTSSHTLIFLGPKIEPWLVDEPDARKHCIRMSQSFERIIEVYTHATYIDCLTMFCGATANIPGALLGGRAVAEEYYFCTDRLHLSGEGYAVWKLAVESALREKLGV